MIHKLTKIDKSSYIGKTRKYRVSKKRKELYKYTYTTNDFYYTLPDEIKSKIIKSQYVSIMKDYFEDFVNRVILNRERINISKLLGTHRMRKYKLKGLRRPSIDYAKTKLHDTLILHNNSHTNGFYFSWYWDKRDIKKLKHSAIYGFDLQPKQARKIAKEIFRCAKDPYTKDYDALS